MDATTSRFTQVDAKNVSLQTGADAVGDVIFLPTDTAGTPGILNSEVLEKLGLGISLIPRFEDLLDGYKIVRTEQMQICFVVTVGKGNTANLLKRNLKAALNDKRMSNAKSLWIPLMGTGTGRLAATKSHEIILETLQITKWLSRSDVKIVIALPPSDSDNNSKDKHIEDEGADSGAKDDDPPEDADVMQLPLSAAVRSALEFAAALRNGRRQHGGPISTTLLLFALAESQTEAAPRDLAHDRAASLFSGAIHSLAGKQRFREAWHLYFSPEYILPTTALPRPPAVKQTPNVRDVLTHAATLAKSGAQIEIDNVIVSLLRHSKGRHRSSISAMGLSMEDLLSEYLEALTGDIGKTLLNDVAAETDRLGYESYANAISDFLTDAATPPPLSISIQAPWGAGKSSLMQQIRNKLDPREQRERNKPQGSTGTNSRLRLRDVLSFLDQTRGSGAVELAESGRLWTVWFNAWKYDTSEQVWAGLVDAIVSQISARLKPVDRELFLLRLQLARIDDGIVRQKIYDRVVTVWWAKARAWSLSGAATIATLLGLKAAVADKALDPTVQEIIVWSPVASIVALAVYLIGTYLISREKINNEPASFSLAEYLRVPDYEQTLGSIHHIHEDLIRVLSVTPLQKGKKVPSPIVIFIDDLDRCSPSKVASVVEGVSMFLASEDYRSMFVIGIDPQMIAAALEEAHARVREQLPRYERTVPLGWRFMDKFIQLPFTIPPSSKDALEFYVGWLSDREPLETTDEIPSSASDQTPTENKLPPPLSPDSPSEAPTVSLAQEQLPDQTRIGTFEAVKMFKESRDVGAIIQEAARNTSGNPREIKRLANLARLYLGLRNARRSRDKSWRSPSIGQYARWVTVTLRWPDMMRWLQWGADEGTWAPKQASLGMVERRLQFLQDQARIAETAETWTEALASGLKVPIIKESDWACDHKLFEFFQAEAMLASHERLSDAASRGFW